MGHFYPQKRPKHSTSWIPWKLFESQKAITGMKCRDEGGEHRQAVRQKKKMGGKFHPSVFAMLRCCNLILDKKY